MHANKAVRILMALSMCLIATAAVAQDSAAGPTIGELSRIQAETLLFKARAERAKAQEELNGGQVLAASDEALPPVVSRVFGAGDKLKARFLYEGGAWIERASGDVIDGGYRVTSVTYDRVIVERKGKRTDLAFSGQAPVRQRREETRSAPAGMAPFGPMPAFQPTPPPAGKEGR